MVTARFALYVDLYSDPGNYQEELSEAAELITGVINSYYPNSLVLEHVGVDDE